MSRTVAITGLALVIFIVIVIGMILLTFSAVPIIQENSVRVGWIPFSCNLPFFVATERGYFQEQGLNITPVKFEVTNLLMDALVSGKLDAAACVGYTTVFAVESASQNQSQFKMYGNLFEDDKRFQHYFLIRNDSNISSISDLKGKKIGTYTGTTQLLWIKLLLNKFNISQNDVTIVQVGLPLQVQALLSGQMDVLLTIEPYATSALDKGAKVFMEKPRNMIINPLPGGPNGMISVKFISEKPDVARKIKVAMDKAVDFINSNEEEAKKSLPKYTPVTEDLAQKVRLYVFEKNPANKTAIQELADILYEGGEIKNPIDTFAMFYE